MLLSPGKVYVRHVCATLYIYPNDYQIIIKVWHSRSIAPGSAAQATLQQPEDAAQRIEFILVPLAPMKSDHKS